VVATWVDCSLSREITQVRRVNHPRRAMMPFGVTNHPCFFQSIHAMGTERGAVRAAHQPMGPKMTTQMPVRKHARTSRWERPRHRARGWAGCRVIFQGSAVTAGRAWRTVWPRAACSTMGTMPSACRSSPSTTPRPAVSMLMVP